MTRASGIVGAAFVVALALTPVPADAHSAGFRSPNWRRVAVGADGALLAGGRVLRVGASGIGRPVPRESSAFAHTGIHDA